MCPKNEAVFYGEFELLSAIFAGWCGNTGWLSIIRFALPLGKRQMKKGTHSISFWVETMKEKLELGHAATFAA